MNRERNTHELSADEITNQFGIETTEPLTQIQIDDTLIKVDPEDKVRVVYSPRDTTPHPQSEIVGEAHVIVRDEVHYLINNQNGHLVISKIIDSP